MKHHFSLWYPLASSWKIVGVVLAVVVMIAEMLMVLGVVLVCSGLVVGAGSGRVTWYQQQSSKKSVLFAGCPTPCSIGLCKASGGPQTLVEALTPSLSPSPAMLPATSFPWGTFWGL